MRPTEFLGPTGFEITRSSPPIPAIDVPSSARPEVPRVLYIVPMFTWNRPRPTKDGATSSRSGGGLRVYLERSWYSSGDDELLGVVIPDGRVKQTPAPDDDSVKPYLTHWGADPIAASDLPHTNLALTDFPRRTDTSRGRLTLDERDGYLVAVAGHEVEYDPVRRLWFSDVVIDPGSAYSPFVRLALARFQPHSVETGGRGGTPLKNVHLSRVVLGDFMQLLPARTASVGFGSPLVVSLKGVGVHKNDVTVAVEAQQPDLPTDLGWRPLAGTAVQAVTPAKPDPQLRRWTVTLPPGKPASPRRLVIREHEVIPTDRDGNVQGQRLVYAETFDL